jgi:hypothetical protein
MSNKTDVRNSMSGQQRQRDVLTVKQEFQYAKSFIKMLKKPLEIEISCASLRVGEANIHRKPKGG